MTKDEEIQYWKEKYRISRLDNQTKQQNEERMQKFKMVYIIEGLLDTLNIDRNRYSKDVIDNLFMSQIAITKAKVNKELGFDYLEQGSEQDI